MTELRPLLTVADVATLTGLSEYTIRQAIRDLELPAMKLRGRLRITEDALTGVFPCSRCGTPWETHPASWFARRFPNGGTHE